MRIWIGENHKGIMEGSMMPLRDATNACSLCTSIHHLPSGRVAVDLTYREEPSLEDRGKTLASPSVSHVAAEVSPGQVVKAPLLTDASSSPQRRFEVVVSKPLKTGPSGPPPTAHAYTVHFDLTEPRTNGEKQLAAPTSGLSRGNRPSFLWVSKRPRAPLLPPRSG